jgi:hypothetical protein
LEYLPFCWSNVSENGSEKGLVADAVGGKNVSLEVTAGLIDRPSAVVTNAGGVGEL